METGNDLNAARLRDVPAYMVLKLEGNVLRNLRPAMFQMLMFKILHI